MKKSFIAGLLLSTTIHALPNSQTIILHTTRANLAHSQPVIECWRGHIDHIEITKESDTVWKMAYETPQRLVDCSLVFEISYGESNACMYKVSAGFMIGNGTKPSPDMGFYDDGHKGTLNPASEGFSYCPTFIYAETDWRHEKNITHLYL